MKKILNNMLKKFGYEIIKTRKDEEIHEKSMEQSINQISIRHKINTVVDIGASDGRWSRAALRYYPQAQYLLIEAQPIHERALSAFVQQNANTQFVLAAAGDSSGSIYFDAGDPLGGQASYTPYAENNITVPVVTVDEEVKKRDLKGPYLLKLDTHGFEVPILKGSINTLKETNVIIVECYNFKIAPECLLFDEMCSYMGEFGFRCIDLVDPHWRPFDQAFWQMDLVFVKKESPEFVKTTYN